MINPVNIIKIDDVRNSEGKTFHVGNLPDYEQEDYDLSNQRDFEKFIKDVKAEVRGSFEYREMVKYLRNYGGMDKSGLSPMISNTDNNNIKIEIHHTPFVLEDIIRIIYEKRQHYHEDLSLEMVAKEVMEAHYKCLIGLYPLTATEHELVHNGYLFIPPENVFGRYDLFIDEYKDFIDMNDQETIMDIEEYSSNKANIEDQNKIISQSNIYLDPDGAYALPEFNKFQKALGNRIDTIRNNMYSLPMMGENTSASNLIPGIYFLEGETDGINDY